MASLAQKDVTQATIVRKLTSYARQNQTKKALWELENICRTLYILEFIDDLVAREWNRLAAGFQALALVCRSRPVLTAVSTCSAAGCAPATRGNMASVPSGRGGCEGVEGQQAEVFLSLS